MVLECRGRLLAQADIGVRGLLMRALQGEHQEAPEDIPRRVWGCLKPAPQMHKLCAHSGPSSGNMPVCELQFLLACFTWASDSYGFLRFFQKTIES